MPVHDLGYRGWDEGRVPKLLRPWVVAKSGISLIWRRKWLRFLMVFAWLPIIFPGIGIFMFEFASTDSDLNDAVVGLLSSPMFNQPELAFLVRTDPAAARHQVWSAFILGFFRYPQGIAMMLLVGLIAPLLITYDLRSKAYLMYFSRPLTPSEYLLGKSGVIWFFLSLIITLPALGVYVLGVLLSPSLSVIGETWDIPLRILGASAVLMIPTTAVALCFSAFTTESRYASFGWFATWVMGSVAYRLLTYPGRPPRQYERPRFRGRGGFDGPPGDFGPPGRGGGGRRVNPEWEQWMESIDLDKYRFVSPYDTLGKVEAAIFDLDTTPAAVWPYWMWLGFITVVCLWLIRRRIVKRLSV